MTSSISILTKASIFSSSPGIETTSLTLSRGKDLRLICGSNLFSSLIHLRIRCKCLFNLEI